MPTSASLEEEKVAGSSSLFLPYMIVLYYPLYYEACFCSFKNKINKKGNK
jgi:hypothetical protein